VGAGRDAHPSDPRDRQRRWHDAVSTSRLNQAQWAHVTGAGINVDLDYGLDTLRKRIADALSRNPLLEGIVDTYATMAVGAEGPTLQVLETDRVYAAAVERAWNHEFAPNCDASGDTSLQEVLWGDVRDLWQSGDVPTRLIADETIDAPIRSRFLHYTPDRLATPWPLAGEPAVVMGVRRNRYGRATAYYVTAPVRMGVQTLNTGQYEEIPADQLCLLFERLERDQGRGVPWLAPALATAADISDYDVQTLDAARAAADTGVRYYTDDPRADLYVPGSDEQTETERRTESFIPPGWKAMQLNPSHPSAQYAEFRILRTSEIGRVRGMPEMFVRLTAKDQNLASARYDARVFGLRLAWVRRVLLARKLSWALETVRREAELSRLVKPGPPRVAHRWSWPPLPSIDEEADQKAKAIRLSMRTATFDEILLEEGKDPERHRAALARANEDNEAAGIPPIETAPGTLPAMGNNRTGIRPGGDVTGGGGDGNDSGNDPGNQPPAKSNGRPGRRPAAATSGRTGRNRIGGS
jgi:capsid protein